MQEVRDAATMLDQNVLTIGFARRFTNYKRATLLMRDMTRLEGMLCSEKRPVQFIFAGKAHPADHEGKRFIQEIEQFARGANVMRRIVFIENYDINIARRMVQGVDVWLNTPRRPHEASGTSGMKAAINGALNLSILDGWWCEGYTESCGWAIGKDGSYDDPEEQDIFDSQSLFNLLENEVIPCFYDRGGDIPRKWIAMMKASIAMGLCNFSSYRMVEDYQNMAYGPAIHEYDLLSAGNFKLARDLVIQRKRMVDLWPKIDIESVGADRNIDLLHVGDSFTVTAGVSLGNLTPDEVEVEVYHGLVNPHNEIDNSHVDMMSIAEKVGEGIYLYRHRIICRQIGRYGYTARVTAKDARWKQVMPGFLTWADDTGPAQEQPAPHGEEE